MGDILLIEGGGEVNDLIRAELASRGYRPDGHTRDGAGLEVYRGSGFGPDVILLSHRVERMSARDWLTG